MNRISGRMDGSIERLFPLYLEVLERLYVSDALLFRKGMKWDSSSKRFQMDVPSPRHTVICLLAINQLKYCGFKLKWNTEGIMQKLLSPVLEGEISYGLLGLLLWADLLGEQNNREAVWRRLHTVLSNLMGGKVGFHYPTVDISWALLGLSHYYQHAKDRGEVEKIGQDLYSGLCKNFNARSKLFHRSSYVRSRNPFVARYRQTISSFAGQIFPVLALTAYAYAFKVREPLEIAMQCGDKLCRLQGPQGQWWQVYNVEKGRVAEGYPVFSVHQDGMAPLALFQLSRATSDNRYEKAALHGINWCLGQNELDLSLVDWDSRVVWGGIRRKDLGQVGAMQQRWIGKFNALASTYLCGLTCNGLMSRITQVELITEVQSYQQAWFLMAFSGGRRQGRGYG